MTLIPAQSYNSSYITRRVQNEIVDASRFNLGSDGFQNVRKSRSWSIFSEISILVKKFWKVSILVKIFEKSDFRQNFWKISILSTKIAKHLNFREISEIFLDFGQNFQLRLRKCLFGINTVNIHTRRRDNIKVVIYFYGAHAILIVNIAEYLCMETSTKVSSEPLSWKPPWEEVYGQVTNYEVKGA